jgi:hypothetical protein
MGEMPIRLTFAIGAVVAVCACPPAWASSDTSDQTTKSAPPFFYTETIHRPDCPSDEHCRLGQRCVICDADRQR